MFHADEACAISMLMYLKKFRGCKIVRTRDPKESSKCNCLVDVGGVYDPATLRFDHHQSSFKDTFSPEYPLIRMSSAGLIWKHYGRRVLVEAIEPKLQNPGLYGYPPNVVSLLHDKIYDMFFKEMDAHDNGITPYPQCMNLEPLYIYSTTLAMRVRHMNPSWIDPEEESSREKMMQRFMKAVQLTGDEMRQCSLRLINDWLPARSYVYEALEKRFDVHPSGEIIQLQRGVPWESYVFEWEKTVQQQLDSKSGNSSKNSSNDNQDQKRTNNVFSSSSKLSPLSIPSSIKYVIFPVKNARMVRAVPIRLGSFESRKPFPKPWRGLSEGDLQAVCKIPKIKFVHNTGFLSSHPTEQGARLVASTSLEYKE
jgi:uncharacterized UPF0160 family protein